MVPVCDGACFGEAELTGVGTGCDGSAFGVAADFGGASGGAVAVCDGSPAVASGAGVPAFADCMRRPTSAAAPPMMARVCRWAGRHGHGSSSTSRMRPAARRRPPKPPVSSPTIEQAVIAAHHARGRRVRFLAWEPISAVFGRSRFRPVPSSLPLWSCVCAAVALRSVHSASRLRRKPVGAGCGMVIRSLANELASAQNDWGRYWTCPESDMQGYGGRAPV